MSAPADVVPGAADVEHEAKLFAANAPSLNAFEKLASGQDVARLKPETHTRGTGIAYILRDNSAFADMTVEENLCTGG